MSKDKAKEFLLYLKKHPKVAEKMKGFTLEEIKEALEDLKNEGKIKEDDELLPHTA
jgi:DNA-binding transcriptional MerR regulator